MIHNRQINTHSSAYGTQALAFSRELDALARPHVEHRAIHGPVDDRLSSYARMSGVDVNARTTSPRSSRDHIMSACGVFGASDPLKSPMSRAQAKAVADDDPLRAPWKKAQEAVEDKAATIDDDEEEEDDDDDDEPKAARRIASAAPSTPRTHATPVRHATTALRSTSSSPPARATTFDVIKRLRDVTGKATPGEQIAALEAMARQARHG